MGYISLLIGNWIIGYTLYLHYYYLLFSAIEYALLQPTCIGLILSYYTLYEPMRDMEVLPQVHMPRRTCLR